MQTNTTPPKSFVQTYLPWLVLAASLLFYLFTLHRSLTFPGLITLPQITGSDWQPIYHGPLHYLLTLPIRWLPPGWQLVAVNAFAAVCAALSLGLLARSVSLLPQDRTRDQRQLEASDYSFLSGRFAWAPPLFAVLVCALQYSFWQHAIVDTGEALDLLLFSYLVRCLLESRIDPRDSWLARAAFVYGLSITNNFAMIGFFPAFLLAVIWIRGLRFFEFSLIAQIVLWGLAGLSLYFLLPTVNSLAGLSEQGFWEMIRMNIGAQKAALTGFPRYILLLISLTSLLPVLFIGIRWPAQFGDINPAGNALTNLMTHVIHAVFLLACLYVSFDPPFSPRRLGHPYPLLPFYFLGALGVGYFTGYFLLVFGQAPAKGWQRTSQLRRIINYAVVTLLWIAIAAVPIGLFVHNRPEIVRNNNPVLSQYGQASLQSLPPDGAVVLSDDPYRLYAVAAALTEKNTADKYILLNTSALAQPAYHAYLLKKYPERWRKFGFLADRPLGQLIPSDAIVDLLVALSQERSLYYLHPSVGYFFEKFYLKPHHLVYSLHPYPTNDVAFPPLSQEDIADNDAFWKRFYTERLMKLGESLSSESGLMVDPLTTGVGAMYSRQLNFFGVRLQRSDAVKKASEYFNYALELNPQNPLALVNHEFNIKLQSGSTENPEPSARAKELLGAYRGQWNPLIRDNGPVDEPNSCFLLAMAFSRGKNYHQAAQELMRVVTFQPSNEQAQVALAITYARAGLPEKCLEIVKQIRARPDFAQADISDALAVLQAEAWGYAKQDRWDEAEKLLLQAQSDHPQSPRPFAALADLYLEAGRMTNALQVFEKQIAAQPDNSAVRVNYSALLIQNRNFDQAAQVLTGLLMKEPQSIPALQNRAIAYLLNGKLDEAKADYEALLKASPTPSRAVYYGLGEIAFQKHDKKKALDYYNKYLEIAPPDSAETRFIRDRIKATKRGPS